MPSIDKPLYLLRETHESPAWAALEGARECLDEGSNSSAMQRCHEASRIALDMGDTCCTALAEIHKARVHGLLGKQSKAGECAKHALRRFQLLGDKHNQAICHLVLAQVHYDARAMEEARSAYNSGGDLLKRLRDQAKGAGNSKLANEYDDLVQQIEKRLKHIDKAIAAQYAPREPVWEPAVSGISGDSLDLELNRVLPVIGPIPAGPWMFTTDDIQDVVPLAHQLIIEDKRYWFKHLYNRGGVTRLDQREYSYYLSPVHGDSMDQAGIEEGDYVILRRSKNLPVRPSPGNIVAASIIGVDGEATLKRYAEQGDTIILRPESSNPELQPYRFKKAEGGVAIVAIAISVLKRID